MSFPRRFLLLSLLACLAPAFSARAESTPVRDKNVEAQLVADVSAIEPGKPFTLGLKLSIDPTWHTYWINPGETGIPTTIDLTLPEGFEAGELQYPIPKKFITDFGYNIVEAGYGYKDSVIHPVQITPPAGLKPGDKITISGHAGWLMCDPKTCVPGKADLSITLPVAASAAPSPDKASIDFYKKNLPTKADWPVTVSLDGENVVVKAEVPEGTFREGATLHLYPFENGIYDQLSDAAVSVEGTTYTFATKKHEKLTAAPEAFSGLVVAETSTGKTGYEISTSQSEAPVEVTEAKPKEATPTETASSDSPEEDQPFGGGLLGMLLAAFIGGMILNIMPCVFPVISLKIMSFVGQAGHDQKKVFMHALIFTLGILVFFWVLTIAILIVGQSASWGFQLQYPGFVIGMIFVMIVVAMSLFGVFEIGTSMTGMGGSLAAKAGYAGSFWSGALAVLLATPCTAPFMAPAIAFALSQSGLTMFLVFTAVGLGLAAPYFVFSLVPKLLDMIPAPGPWMDTFKQLMGFPMLAVVVWLTGVLSKQLNVTGLQWSLAAALLIGLAGWILGRFTGFDRSAKVRTIGRVAAVLVGLLSIGIAYKAAAQRAPANSEDISQVIAEHRAEGKNVFVDFTAEWCVTCQVNKRATLKTDEIKNAFKDNNIEFVTADFTNEDPRIATILRENNRDGVPLYLLYPKDQSLPPIRLNDGFITKGDVYEAIKKLPN